MLKSVLYWLLVLLTSMRLIDITYLLLRDRTNLPIAVMAVSAAMIIYGVVLLAKRIAGKVSLRQLMYFYVLQTAMIAFNLFYISVFSPLRIDATEIVLAGTFLEILMNCCVVYLCAKKLRRRYFAVVETRATSLHA